MAGSRKPNRLWRRARQAAPRVSSVIRPMQTFQHVVALEDGLLGRRLNPDLGCVVGVSLQDNLVF